MTNHHRLPKAVAKNELSLSMSPAPPIITTSSSAGHRVPDKHSQEVGRLPRALLQRAMNMQVAVLCDAATDYQGKLNILGTFDTIYTSKLPAFHPQCSVALRVVFQRIEEGAHKVKMNFVDEDGKFVMPSLDVPVQVSFPEEEQFISRNFIINIQQLKFDKVGVYSIDIAVDGRQEISIPLSVKLSPQPETSPAGI